MRITHIGALYQLTTDVLPVNAYLVEEENSLTLVDAALPFCCRAILKAAAAIGKPIDRILLTHAHFDHIGALEKLKQALPEAKLHVSRRESRLLRGDKTLNPDEPQRPIRGGIPHKSSVEPDVQIEDGDRIGSLTAIAVPGHTPGSMALLDTRDNAMLVGDAFQLVGRAAVAGQMVLSFPFPAMATWDKDLAWQSAEKMLLLKPSLLAAGHGAMRPNPEEAMKKAIYGAR